MTKRTLQVLTVSQEDDGKYVCEYQSMLSTMPSLPVHELRFDSLNDVWEYLGQWFGVCAEVERLVDGGLLSVEDFFKL